MRSPGIQARLTPAILASGAAAAAAVLVALAPAAHAHILLTCPASSTCPTPTPVNAFLTLDVTAGGPATAITVTGASFLPNEAMSLYWDQPSKVAGSAVANSQGNFTAHVKPFSGDPPGVHRVCATVPPRPCANFTLQATASPSPTSSPSASASPSPDASPSTPASPGRLSSPTPVAATVNGLDVILKPPLVILPIIGAIGLLIALGYWILSAVRRPQPEILKSAAVSHLATRPDYTVGFGTPPPVPPPPAPTPSAWPEQPSPMPPPAPEPAAYVAPPEASTAPPEAAGGPPEASVEEVAPPAAPDEPPELPEASD